MVKTNILQDVINSVIGDSACFLVNYDRKLLIIGLMTLFTEKLAQGQIDDLASKCLETSILTLHV